MRSTIQWGAVLAVGVALLGTAAVAGAQQAATIPMTVTENRAPGAAGQTTITPLGNNQVRVDIRITGLPANEQRAAHIHSAEGARCDTGAPITHPLDNVQVDASGVGTSSTTLTLAANNPIPANNSYVNVHQNNVAAGGGPGPGVICGNITQTFAAGAAGAAGAGGATALPRTGTGGLQADTSGSWMLAGMAAFALLLGGTGALAAARRRK
jgi:hypothetical protein